MREALLGEAFPADDEVAQFVLVMCAQRNDLSEVLRQVVDAAKRDRDVMHYYHRLVVSHYFEAIRWLTHAVKESEAVAAWLNELPDEIKENRDALLATGKKTGIVNRILWAGRASTFHYPKVGAEKDKLAETIEAIRDDAAHVIGVLDPSVGNNAYHPRFEFAEKLMTHRMYELFAGEGHQRILEIQRAAMRYVTFADNCLEAYRIQRDLSLGEGHWRTST